MTQLMPEMTTALRDLDTALDAPHATDPDVRSWRWSVRKQLSVVRDALLAAATEPEDDWLAQTGRVRARQCLALLTRLGALGPRVLEDADVSSVRSDVRRLGVDIGHHVQRLHDLAYDDVELELGGSE